MSTSTAALHPEFRPWADWLVAVARYWGLRPRVTSTYRSLAEQARLYRLRQERPDLQPYPVAPPGQSLHNYGLALDMVSTDNARLGALWRHYGGSWSPSDAVHFGV